MCIIKNTTLCTFIFMKPIYKKHKQYEASILLDKHNMLLLHMKHWLT